MKKIIKKYYITHVITALLFFVPSQVLGDEARTDPVHKINGSVQKYFQPLEGTVRSAGDGGITVGLDDGKDIAKGMRLSVFRERELINHPVTGDPIGHREDLVGRVEVMEKSEQDGVYLCSAVTGDIREGDIVRMTSSRIKLAFFQDRKAEWTLSESFFTAVKDSGRFTILEAYTPSSRPEDLARLAREQGGEAVLFLSTPVKNGKRVLNAKLYWAADAALFAEIEEEAEHVSSDLYNIENDFIAAEISEREPWGYYQIPAGRLIASGDVNNNNQKELVVSDGSNVRIFSMKNGPLELWYIKGGKDERHLSIDVLDLNKNGAAEIFITSLTEGGSIATDDNMRVSGDGEIRSYVVEYDPAEGYRKIKKNIPYFMRVMGQTLFMQKFSRQHGFSGSVHEAEWREQDYQPLKPVTLPDSVNIYGFIFIDWKNSGQTHVLAFNDNGFLQLFDGQGNRLWVSSASYGSSPLSFTTEAASITDRTRKWYVRSRLVSVKTERGHEAIALKRISLVSQVRMPNLGSTGAEVYSLWWDGEKMEEKMVLAEVVGNITDFLIEGKKLFFIAADNIMSFVKRAVKGEFSRGSKLYYYSFTDR